MSATFPGVRRTAEAVYIEYADSQHEIEYYDIAKDPYETDNTANQLTPRRLGPRCTRCSAPTRRPPTTKRVWTAANRNDDRPAGRRRRSRVSIVASWHTS